MRGLRARLVFTAWAASGAALLAVLALTAPGLRRRALDRTRDLLLAEARLMGVVVEQPLAEGLPSDQLDALVDASARETRGRVTIVAPDGRVLADSAVSGPALLTIENQGDRPEVRAALSSGVGVSVRRSPMGGDELLYVAVRIQHGSRLLGVTRVELSLGAVIDEMRELRRSIVLAFLIAFVLTGLLSIALSSSVAGPLRAITESARRFADGDLAARSLVQRPDELGELARILNRSADQLQGRMAELAQERARTDAILSALEEGLLAVDHRGTVLLVNDGLRQGLELEKPEGRHYLEAIRHSELNQLIREVLRTGERRTGEVGIHHRGRIYAVTGRPFPGAEGAPHGAVLSFVEVTERRRLEQVRRDLVANASHELRTPLTSIRGFVEAIEDGADADTTRRFLAKIRAHADRMAALIEDLLELSRLESGERPPSWEAVDARELVEEVVASLGELARSREISVTCAVDGIPALQTDPERLRRILENLLENALKYTPGGGKVAVSVRSGPDGATLFEVIDDGPGIAPEHLRRIFERFYRVDKARSRESGGTGLGLAIVKHLAEGMGARVSVESQVGEGSRFRVSVPPRNP